MPLPPSGGRSLYLPGLLGVVMRFLMLALVLGLLFVLPVSWVTAVLAVIFTVGFIDYMAGVNRALRRGRG